MYIYIYNYRLKIVRKVTIVRRCEYKTSAGTTDH